MRARLACLLMAISLCSVIGFLFIFIGDLQRADDDALATRLSVVAQDVRETIEARARLGLKLRYMSDLQAMIERERAASPGLSAITIRSDKKIVLYSTDRVSVGEERREETPGNGWTHVGAQAVTVGFPILNSFAERLGDVEVSALRGGLDVVHLQPLAQLAGVAAVFLLLTGAMAWLGSTALLHLVHHHLQIATDDARRALNLIHNGSPGLAVGGRLTVASDQAMHLIRAAAEDVRRLDEVET